MRDVAGTIAWCANEEAAGGPVWEFHCLAMCRVAWGIEQPAFPDAMSAWLGSTHGTGPAPVGAPIYFTLPNTPLGHVAIQGPDRQWCYSIDILRSDGHVDYVPIQMIREDWGGRDLGWTTALERVDLPLGDLPTAVTGWINPGSRVVADAAFPPAPGALVDAGYQALASYLSTPTTQSKNWSPRELVAAKRAGLGIIMFVEQAESTILTGYSPQNIALGRQGQTMADNFGVPDDNPLWMAVDINAAGQFDKVFGAFTAYRETISRPLGVYGGSQIIEALLDAGLADYGHIAAALSWSITGAPVNGETVFFFQTGPGRGFNYYLTPRASMRQYPSEPFAGSRIDPNDVNLAIPVWRPGATPDQPPVTAQEADDMPVLMTNDEPYPEFEPARSLGYVPPDGPGGLWPVGWIWYELVPAWQGGGGKLWLPGGPSFDALYAWCQANNVAGIKRTTGQLQQIPDYVPPATGGGGAAPNHFAGTLDLNARTVDIHAAG